MAAGIAAVLLLTFFIVPTAFLARRRERHLYGPRVAQKYFRLRLTLIPVVIGSLILAALGRKAGLGWLPRVENTFALTIALIECGAVVRWISLRREAGALLFDLDRYREWKVMVALGVTTLIGAAAGFALSYFDGSLTWQLVSANILVLASGATLIIAGLSHFELRTDGVLRYPHLHFWADIATFRFEHGGRNLLSLTLRHRTWKFEKELHIPVSSESEQEIVRILSLHGVLATEGSTKSKQLQEQR